MQKIKYKQPICSDINIFPITDIEKYISIFHTVFRFTLVQQKKIMILRLLLVTDGEENEFCSPI